MILSNSHHTWWSHCDQSPPGQKLTHVGQFLLKSVAVHLRFLRDPTHLKHHHIHLYHEDHHNHHPHQHGPHPTDYPLSGSPPLASASASASTKAAPVASTKASSASVSRSSSAKSASYQPVFHWQAQCHQLCPKSTREHEYCLQILFVHMITF